jgi:hypothetical protein
VTIPATPPPAVGVHLEYAYAGNSAGSNHGKHHVVLDADLRAGRLVRVKGDALCRPRKSFWGLYGGNHVDLTAPDCVLCAKRYAALLSKGAICPLP